MTTSTTLPTPSSKHATCAWCAIGFGSAVELIDHVDAHHLFADKRAIRTIQPWAPTPMEVAAIVAEMRPIIDVFVERDRNRLRSLGDAVPA
jgi:hypothetical protein